MPMNDLEMMKETLLSIPEDQVSQPAYPISIFLQDCTDLYKWVQKDKPKLLQVGITDEMIEELLKRNEATRFAQADWNNEFQSIQDATKDWKAQSPAAFKFHDNLIAAFRYAFRRDKKLSDKVSSIAEGSSNADMIQDLMDLSVLGKANQALLEAISFDLLQLDQAAEMANNLSLILAAANGSRMEYSETLDLRNRAYSYLKVLSDEIREAGKYVFRNDYDRQKGYFTPYWKYRDSKTNKTETVLQG